MRAEKKKGDNSLKSLGGVKNAGGSTQRCVDSAWSSYTGLREARIAKPESLQRWQCTLHSPGVGTVGKP